MLGGIYIIRNTINGKSYIGQTNNLERREMEHFSKLKNGSHKNPHLQNAVAKDGIDNFEFKWILSCVNVPDEYMTKMEQYFVTNWKPEYNIRQECVNSNKGLVHSQETIDYLRQINLGNQYALGNNPNEEARKRISESKKGAKNPNYGKPATNKGIPHTEATRKKMSDSAKARYANKKEKIWELLK